MACLHRRASVEAVHGNSRKAILAAMAGSEHGHRFNQRPLKFLASPWFFHHLVVPIGQLHWLTYTKLTNDDHHFLTNRLHQVVFPTNRGRCCQGSRHVPVKSPVTRKCLAQQSPWEPWCCGESVQSWSCSV